MPLSRNKPSGTGPDVTRQGQEQIADRLYDYLRQYPMDAKQRLELALSVLRDLPEGGAEGGEGVGTEQALALLHSRLPEPDTSLFPPLHPELCRTHMPTAVLGRPQTESHAKARSASRWSQALFLLLLAALLALTLFFSLAAQWGADYVA